MSENLTTSIVRILAPDGSTVGTGFLVTGDGLIATCAHVVEACGASPGGRVQLAFWTGDAPVEADVLTEGWHPNHDVVFLRLATPLPDGVTSVTLGSSAGAGGHAFRAFGYPRVGDFQGVWAEGRILGQVTDERGALMLQLRAQEIAPGMSGAPVLDVSADRVVGMVTMTYQPDETLKFRDTAFATPTDVLVKACPQLAQFCLDVDRPAYQPITRNLPPLVGHFVGRRSEIESLKARFVGQRSLVAIVGMGGIGKTSLAIAAIQELEERFRDGILWLDVRQYANLDALVMRLGELLCLDLSERTLAEQRQLVNRVLRGKDVLVVADNFESVADPVAVVDYLRGLPCDQMVTSRLHLSEFQDPFLVTPLAADVALRLFAALSQESFAHDPEAQALCDQELGGHPLAIEVVAALAETGMSPEELRRALREEPLDVLGSDGDLAGMWSVVRALNMSYQRLTPIAQMVLTSASVFLADFDLAGLAAVLPDQSRLKLSKAVQELEVRSLVHLTGSKRYRLHIVTRQYAYGNLGERSIHHRRAADYYVHLRTPPETWKTIDDLEPQLTEFEHRVRGGDYDGACQVLEPIDHNYLYLWGHYARLIQIREKLLGQLPDPCSRANNLGSLGRACRALGWVERAIKLLEEALALARKAGDRPSEGTWLSELGNVYRTTGRIEKAVGFYESTLRIARETHNRRGESIGLGGLGEAYRAWGMAEPAIEHYRESLRITREIGDRLSEGIQLGPLGIAYHDLGQIQRAAESYKAALKIARELGNRRAEGFLLGDLGYVSRDLEQIESAIELYQEALAIAREIGHRQDESVWLGNLALAYYGQEEFKQAIELYREARNIAHEISYRLGGSHHLLGLGRCMLATNETSEAYRYCAEALALNVPSIHYQAALTLGTVLLHQGEPTAKEHFTEGAVLCHAMLSKTSGLYKPRYTLATALVGQAVCEPRWAEGSERTALLTPALEEYQRALEITSAPGIIQDALRDLELIRAAGVEGLEPVFELLENVEYKPDLLEDLPDILEEVA